MDCRTDPACVRVIQASHTLEAKKPPPGYTISVPLTRSLSKRVRKSRDGTYSMH